jgi:purine-nucleoside phosphorylase
MKINKNIKNKILEYFKEYNPKIAITLGSGLGGFEELLEDSIVLKYKDIDGYPQSSIEGHKGEIHCGRINGKDILVFSGRFHLYEGYSSQDVIQNVLTSYILGVKKIIITNAAGGIYTGPGSISLITDHINLTGENPLIGENNNQLGTRFPDMSNIYDKDLQNLARNTEKKFNLEEGIYLGMKGPNYETPAEVIMCKNMGASMVGMSTVLESLFANYLGMKVLGFSLITNWAAGLSEDELSHQEVTEIANEKSSEFKEYLLNLIKSIKE